MAFCVRKLWHSRLANAAFLALAALIFIPRVSAQATARFDLVGPRIDVRVTRVDSTGVSVTLPIAAVPNLKPGDKLWIHPDLPSTQSVKYLLIAVFLRGTTNPPPPEWFTRIETWDRRVRAEGTFITVPAEAQQALLFMAPETGGDFSTLRSAVRGRPGTFVRASQDLIEAGFEQARIERYIADIRRVPPADPAELQKHSDLLARTLALKPSADCFKRPVDTQFTCLTQSGSQIVLDDGHGQNVVNALSNGPGSDLIQQASYTQAFGAGVYSAYVGAIVDLVRILNNLHTAQYQYIPAISFPQAEELNLRLNTPPSFHNPKSVLVIALPAVKDTVPPPLRPADPNHVSCLIQPSVVLPTEGAPLVFSADFAHDLVLHLNTPPGAPAEPDIPLTPDAYFGGLVLQQSQQHHVPLHDPLSPPQDSSSPRKDSSSRPEARGLIASRSGETPASAVVSAAGASAPTYQPATTAKPTEPNLGTSAKSATTLAPQPTPVTLTGTITGRWGFDAFTGPTMPLQQLPGSGWHIVTRGDANPDLIAGHNIQLLLASSGTACVHTITAKPTGTKAGLPIAFKPEPLIPPPPVTPETAPGTAPTPPDAATIPGNQVLALTLPLDHSITPGDLNLDIQQFDQPRPDQLAARTFAEPATVTTVELHAGDRSLQLTGSHLNEISQLTLGDLLFTPTPDGLSSGNGSASSPDTLHLALPASIPPPSTRDGEHLSAKLTLHDGRTLTLPVTVTSPRPSLTLLNKTADTSTSPIALPNPDDLALTASLIFTLKSQSPFPRNGQIEIETLDGTLRTVLTLAPSGGLLLQDPHTLVATLDPLRSFGPSAFGALHLRALYPTSTSPGKEVPSRPERGEVERPVVGSGEKITTSDWLPLVTLVRLPVLTQLQCPPDDTQPCTLSGTSLFLVQAISTDPAFATSTTVPDGYTGTTLTLPHPAASTVFLRLRDDPTSIDPATFPTPPATRAHRSAPRQPATPATTPSTQTQKSPASQPGSSTNPPS